MASIPTRWAARGPTRTGRRSPSASAGDGPNSIATQEDLDDRPYLRQILGGGLKALLDPLAGKIDLDYPGRPVDTNANYSLWFGMRYPPPLGGNAMVRMGDRLQWLDRSRGHSAMVRSSVLVSDHDTPYPLPGAYNQVLASHPDPEGKMFLEVADIIDRQAVSNDVASDGFVRSWWTSTTNVERGPIDTNYSFADGSVERFSGVEWDDDRMARVPWDANGSGWTNDASAAQNPSIWHHLPRR